jgi:hypothetical protein
MKWRAKKGGAYWYVNARNSIIWAIDMRQTACDTRYTSGNYYRCPEDVLAIRRTR